MKCIIVYSLIITTVEICSLTVAEVLHVLPDNSSANASCLSQPCATLSQYLLDNGTLPVVSNVEYHFLPGEHHVPANMILQNLYNFSIIGSANNSSSPVVLVGCSQVYVINIINSQFVNIYDVVFKYCSKLPDNKQQFINLKMSCCFSCKIVNVTLQQYGIVGFNLIGKSSLTNVKIEIMQFSKPCCQNILLRYSICLLWHNYSNYIHDLTISQLFIQNYASESHSWCTKAGLCINLEYTMYKVNVLLINSTFYNMNQSALEIRGKISPAKLQIVVANCTFELIRAYPAIRISVTPFNKTVRFINCKFHSNMKVIRVIIQVCRVAYECEQFITNDMILMKTNISFVKCTFAYNRNVMILVENRDPIRGELKANILLQSLIISQTTSISEDYDMHMISITTMNVHINDTFIVTSNECRLAIMHFQSCDILLNGKIIYNKNNCSKVISVDTHIKIMQHTNLSFVKNICHNNIISVESSDEYHQPYPLCLFQYIPMSNNTIPEELLTTHYAINFIYNVYKYHHVRFHGPKPHAPSQGKDISIRFCRYISHCRWLPSAAFHDYMPEAINNKIIQTVGQNCHYHKHICYCNNKTNCSIDVLGNVYPGQMLQTNLCSMYGSDDSSVLYAEVHNINLPSSACKIAHQSQLINFIGNNSNTVNYTIVSRTPGNAKCELFLTASPFLNKIYDTFQVQLLSCPIGFALQDGMCDCDPILPSIIIDKCYIDHSTIRRPANIWITAHTQTNDTKYLISDCPMDYCLPYSSNVNLLYPDSQCQFNRTDILCSQCQHHLSMIFGSSRCMECTNLHILITIIVIVAGIVLVILFYLLHLTVTIGTINGIIFYANVVSINDAVFLVNDNVFKPLRVFISFVNLDLGIETCFYNGMDSYAKKWLQLFFPFYLIIIAISIIIASRYSSRILRLTYTRSLPVLATLFLLSYTGILRTVLTVLFSYSTITHLPSGRQQIVWSIDASVPLFGLKFTILFLTCLVLFLLLIPFNVTLLFTRYTLRFKAINHFKPILDAFQGPYKDKYYYWVAVHIILRSILFTLYGLQTNLRLVLSTMVIVLFTGYHGHSYPYKSKLVNSQELLLLLNLTIMYAVSYQYNESVFSIVTNIMISLAFVQFCTIVLYHFLIYTCHCNIGIMLQTGKEMMIKYCTKNNKHQNAYNVELLNIPECTYNYAEYREELIIQ